MRRRVVVTGMGITSCIGNDLAAVSVALQEGRSGLRFAPEFAAVGIRSQVVGLPDLSLEATIPRRLRRFMGDAAVYAYHAMNKAIADAKLPPSLIQSERTGLILGEGVGSPFEHHTAMQTLTERGLSKVLPYLVPRIMGSTAQANLAAAFGIRGASYAISSACASSGHAIGNAFEHIAWGKQDIVFAGGAEEIHWTTAVPFDAMGALSRKYNDATASRPYDANRDGFVLAGGAGILALEELEHALARRAPIYAELVGYGASSDGADMVIPTANGAARAMRLALQDAQMQPTEIDYINAHATGTPVGDLIELEAITSVFAAAPNLKVSSTKGLTGHPIGASAVHEAIYGLLMVQGGFMAGCTNLQTMDAAALQAPLLRDVQWQSIGALLSNSFGFGGANASLIFRQLHL